MTADINYSNPTRIQRAAIPVLLAGRDALVNAPTGSGKTLAYLAPLINDLQVGNSAFADAEEVVCGVLLPCCSRNHRVVHTLESRILFMKLRATVNAFAQAVQPRLTRAEGTYGIIIAPTRELCIQINDVLGLILRRFIWLVTSCTWHDMSSHVKLLRGTHSTRASANALLCRRILPPTSPAPGGFSVPSAA